MVLNWETPKARWESKCIIPLYVLAFPKYTQLWDDGGLFRELRHIFVILFFSFDKRMHFYIMILMWTQCMQIAFSLANQQVVCHNNIGHWWKTKFLLLIKLFRENYFCRYAIHIRRYWPKKRNTTIDWIENENLALRCVCFEL